MTQIWRRASARRLFDSLRIAVFLQSLSIGLGAESIAALVGADHTALAVLGVLFSVIGAFYYLRVIRLMYFDAPVDRTPLEAGFDVRVLLSANALAMLLLGIFANPILQLCVAAIA